MERLIVGIDDVATETQTVDGWSYFLLREKEYNIFMSNTQEIIENSRLKVFHGKRFTKKHYNTYLTFLKKIHCRIFNNQPSML